MQVRPSIRYVVFAAASLLIAAGPSDATTCEQLAARLGANLEQLDPVLVDKRLRELGELEKLCKAEVTADAARQLAIVKAIEVATCSYKLAHLSEYYDSRVPAASIITIVRARFGEIEREGWDRNEYTCNALSYFSGKCSTPANGVCTMDRGDLGKPELEQASTLRRTGIDICGYDVSEAARAVSLTADVRKNRIEIKYRCKGDEVDRSSIIPGATKVVHIVCPQASVAITLDKTFFENKYCPITLQ